MYRRCVAGSQYGTVDLAVRASFFFQAEDGIRDWSVTGVQTCALPILAVGMGNGSHPKNAHTFPTGCPTHMPRPSPQAAVSRSEERRVGKECRSRWSPEH